MKTAVKAYFDTWIDRRSILQTKTLKLHRKSIYILPTKFGFLFGLTLIAMLIGSINYEVSLGFLLTFLLSAIFFIGMLQTYKNFNTVNLSIQTVKPVFANNRINIQFLSLAEKNAENIGIDINHNISHHNLSKGNIVSIELEGKKRGVHTIKKLKLFSIYPLGHFYAWSWLKTNIEIIVYPQPKALHNITRTNEHNQAGENSSQQKGSDELYSYKPYQTGDSTQRIAWKKTAQTGKLHSQEMSKLITNDYYIDWYQLPNLTTEERLSFMCHLVLQAHKDNIHYGLVLPNTQYKPDHSEQHKHQCLKDLATFT